MKFPLHTFEVSSPSEKAFIRLLQKALDRLPAIVEQEISGADRLRFRLILEDYVVGLLKDMQASQHLSRNWTPSDYLIIVQFEKTQGTICFNGQQQVIPFTT
ncbi:hypothetical protein [Gimesia algae]|uniref:Uncharacterized protein n=1 Tax=Gimesia algae TaxID=2527971 RepID=A0A517VIX6_9PLAN|nr:hypothetical protein [Gimesia algae]QDT92956.1 hypothetical protein Pan161_46280 [Gimesia algae]